VEAPSAGSPTTAAFAVGGVRGRQCEQFFGKHKTGFPDSWQLITENVVNVVNVGERYKSVMFTTYPYERKGLVNVVNVARGFLGSDARHMPKWRKD
jgi:hypothetical protein